MNYPMQDHDPVDTPCAHGEPERFFPASGSSVEQIEKVKAECRPCPLLEPCREWAVVHGELGIWGATSGQDRRHIRERRGIKATPVAMAVVVDDRNAAVRSMVARGFTYAEVAAALGISVSGASQAVLKAKRSAS